MERTTCRFYGHCVQWAENVVDCRGTGFGCDGYQAKEVEGAKEDGKKES